MELPVCCQKRRTDASSWVCELSFDCPARCMGLCCFHSLPRALAGLTWARAPPAAAGGRADSVHESNGEQLQPMAAGPPHCGLARLDALHPAHGRVPRVVARGHRLRTSLPPVPPRTVCTFPRPCQEDNTSSRLQPEAALSDRKGPDLSTDPSAALRRGTASGCCWLRWAPQWGCLFRSYVRSRPRLLATAPPQSRERSCARVKVSPPRSVQCSGARVL